MIIIIVTNLCYNCNMAFGNLFKPKIVSGVPEKQDKSFIESIKNFFSPIVRAVPPTDQTKRVIFDKPTNAENKPTITPTPFPNPRSPQPTSTPMVNPARPGKQIQGGTDLAMDFFRSKVPRGQSLEQMFPVLGDKQFMQGIQEADKKRQGLGNLLLLQAFFESTLGRNTPNTFGVKPGGESRHFASPSEALEFQLGPSVLGGGAGDSLNILNTNEPLTDEDIINLYRAYDSPGAYLQNLLEIVR